MNWKRWILAVLIMTVVATTLAGTVLAPPRDPTITLTLEWIRDKYPDTQGVLLPGGSVVLGERPPDGIEWATAWAKGEGRIWPIRPDFNHPAGATDSDDECESATNTMCNDAGHGNSSDSTRTQHAAEDGGGCTCSGDCDDGAVAMVISAQACG